MMINPDEEEKSPSLRFAERLFNIMDENEDGVLTMEEFVKGFHKLKARQNTDGKGTYKIFYFSFILLKCHRKEGGFLIFNHLK